MRPSTIDGWLHVMSLLVVWSKLSSIEWQKCGYTELSVYECQPTHDVVRTGAWDHSTQ